MEPLDTEGVERGVEKGLRVAVWDPVPDGVAKGLRVAVVDPDLDPVGDGVVGGVPKAVGDCVAVLDLEPDPVRVPEGVGKGEGVPDPLVVCVKEGVKVLVVL